MRSRGALDHVWVRAAVFVPTALVVLVGLYVVTGTLVEGGQEGLGNAFGDVDFAVLIMVMFFGPAWVTRTLPSPWQHDGKKRRSR